MLPAIDEGPRQQWQLLGDDLYFAKSLQGQPVLHRMDLRDGGEERLFDFPERLMLSYSVHPVTRKLTYTYAENISRDVIRFE